MRTKPVFESFTSFVNFLNEAEGDVMNVKAFLSANSTFLDKDAKAGFESARLAATKAPLANTDTKKLSEIIGRQLSDLNDYIKEAIANNNNNPNDQQITEKTITEVKKVVYPALVNGKINLNESINFTETLGIKKLDQATAQAGGWIDLNDALTVINIRNLYTSNNGPSTFKGKGKKWSADGDYIDNTGAKDQVVISSIASGINFSDNDRSVPGDESKIIADLSFGKKKANLKKDKKAYRTFVIYGVGTIVEGGGESIPDTLIKKEFSEYTVPGEVEEYQVALDGGDAMFKQGSAEINKDNKDKIDKLITNALSRLAGKPESIVITGGASYEPDGQGPINKKLVVERANAIKTYIETLYPALTGLIKVNDKDFSKIQPNNEPKEYEQYRKVYLDIKGVIQGQDYTEVKEKEYLVESDINQDSVEIIQYAISMEYDLPNDKE